MTDTLGRAKIFLSRFFEFVYFFFEKIINECMRDEFLHENLTFCYSR